MNFDPLVAGLGSPHGDDQAGWLVVEALRRRGMTGAVAVRDPADLLDLLPDCRRVILVDACRSGTPAGTITRLVWPDERIGAPSTHSTHGMAISEVLRLAERLDRLPESVVFYGLEIDCAAPACGPTPLVRTAIDRVAELILRETDSEPSGHHA